VGFKATDDNTTSSTIKYVTITVNKVLKDSSFRHHHTAPGPAPTRCAGATPVIFPIDLISAQAAVYGIQFDMSYPGDIAQIDSIVVTTRTPEYVVYENIGSFPIRCGCWLLVWLMKRFCRPILSPRRRF